jgi:hypothetical protein
MHSLDDHLLEQTSHESKALAQQLLTHFNIRRDDPGTELVPKGLNESSPGRSAGSRIFKHVHVPPGTIDHACVRAYIKLMWSQHSGADTLFWTDSSTSGWATFAQSRSNP